jgi:2-hydroxy-3-oxopropionate reductase
VEETVTHIAFIGLGIMGAPMAANLVKAGHDVRGHNRSEPPRRRLAELGGVAARSVADAVDGADVVITMLPDGPDVSAVCLGDEGVYARARRGALHIDMSSIAPDVAVRLAEAAAESGLRALDAPVSGGQAGAVEGRLSIMAGGDEATYAEALPVLEAMGSTVVHVGPNGSGQTVKAANQLIVAGTIELVAEAIVFLEAYGVDTARAMRVLDGGLAGNRIIERKSAAMLERDFTPGFRVELHHKDLGIVTSAARAKDVVIPLGAVTAQLMAALLARGDGHLDHSALLKLVAELSGKHADAR